VSSIKSLGFLQFLVSSWTGQQMDKDICVLPTLLVHQIFKSSHMHVCLLLDKYVNLESTHLIL
jgi:hypothetical protein